MSLNHSGNVAWININSCLHARFDIAQYLYDHDEPRRDESSTCLYNFHAQTGDYQISAMFNCPKIKFVSDHELIFKIKIRKASYQKYKEPGVVKDEPHKLGRCTLAFRVPFIHEMDGNTEHFILKLDFAEYRPKTPSANLPDFWLVNCLTNSYIPTLKQAGHDILCVCASSKFDIPRNPSYFVYPGDPEAPKKPKEYPPGAEDIRRIFSVIVGPDIPYIKDFVKETRISVYINGVKISIILRFGSPSFQDYTVHIEVQVLQLPDNIPSKLIKGEKYVLKVGVIKDANNPSNRSFKLDANNVHMEKICSEDGSPEDRTFFPSVEKDLVGLIKNSIVGGTQLGSAYLVHQLFFKTVVLKEVERVNQRTTFVPLVHKEHDFKLELWEDSKATQGEICSWSPHPSDNIEFIWMTKADKYRRAANDYEVSSSTRNVLTILEATTNSVRVKIDGKTTINQQIKGDLWSRVQKKKWSAVVVLTFTTKYGMRAEIKHKDEKPVETTPVLNSDDPKIKESERIIDEHFARLHFLEGLERDFERSFDSVMADLHAQARELIDKRLAFDYDGNLLLELAAPGDHGRFVPGASSNGGSDSDSDEEHNVPKTNGK